MPASRIRTAVAIGGVLALSTGFVACGSSSTNPPSTATTRPATTPTTSGPSPTVTTGPVRGTLRAQNHAPKVGRTWHYSVSVNDSAGKPLTGTVDIAFAFAGQIVGRDTPPTYPLHGGVHNGTLKFPAQSVGQPLTLRAVVHTPQGSITLDWPFTVSK